jgi:hypothetical protein
MSEGRCFYGRRCVKVVETVEGDRVVHHMDVDSSVITESFMIFVQSLFPISIHTFHPYHFIEQIIRELYVDES